MYVSIPQFLGINLQELDYSSPKNIFDIVDIDINNSFLKEWLLFNPICPAIWAHSWIHYTPIPTLATNGYNFKRSLLFY